MQMQDTRYKIQVRSVLRLALAGVLFGALVQVDAADEPVSIRAADVELNQKTGVATYRGRVVMNQGDMTLHADWLEATMRGRDVDSVRATGNPAGASQREPGGDTTTVTAARLRYHADTRTLELADDIELRRGADVLRGNTGRYDLNSGRFEAHGNPARGERVNAVIQPRPGTP
jgi:lipopolysaccharide export system protein LptA